MAKTVIVVDDDQDDIDLLKEMISVIDDSISCHCFTSPIEAIKSIASENFIVPECIITDVNMPGIMGGELVKRLRALKKLDGTVIAVLSTTMRDDASQTLKRDGADLTLRKPNSLEQYRSLLADVLRAERTR